MGGWSKGLQTMAGSEGFMNLTSPALEAEPSTETASFAVNWNGQPFLVKGPVRRSQTIVRTKIVSPELRHKYNRSGWPRHLVLMREYHLNLTGDEMTVRIVTNADEAEDEMPDQIETPHRDIGTFRDATVVWRERPVHSFVSVSLQASICSTLDNVPFIPSQLDAQPPVSPAHFKILEAALKSGIVLRNNRIADALDDEERLLVNLLIASHGEPPRPLSLIEIGSLLGVSDETVRRRRNALFSLRPELNRAVAPFRMCNAKGGNPDAIGTQAVEANESEE